MCKEWTWERQSRNIHTYARTITMRTTLWTIALTHLKLQTSETNISAVWYKLVSLLRQQREVAITPLIFQNYHIYHIYHYVLAAHLQFQYVLSEHPRYRSTPKWKSIDALSSCNLGNEELIVAVEETLYVKNICLLWNTANSWKRSLEKKKHLIYWHKRPMDKMLSKW